MANVLDVAAYILEKCGPMTAMKLQKLTYYSQAWHLVWEEDALFPERVEAWANGPVSPRLYGAHRGNFHVSELSVGDPSALTPSEQGSVNGIVDFYGKFSGHELSELTHSEPPWRDARAGLTDGERSNQEITQSAMHEYYDSLTTSS